MSSQVCSEISDYITKFKGTYDLHIPFREFRSEWLKSFDNKLVENVKIEFECIRQERIWGDGSDNEMVIDNFIVSLENLLNNNKNQ